MPMSKPSEAQLANCDESEEYPIRRDQNSVLTDMQNFGRNECGDGGIMLWEYFLFSY